MNIYERILKKYGQELQLEVLGEECSELSAILHRRHRPNRSVPTSEICDEIADVANLVEQFKCDKFLGPIIKKAMKDKLKRFEQREGVLE